MKLPNFQEFMNTLTQNKITQIISDAQQKCLEASCMGSGEQISAISWTIALELLALYHVWLSEFMPTEDVISSNAGL